MNGDETGSLVGRTYAWISLVAIAVVATGLWRLEVGWHGWEGLTWIEYFHWAVPAGIGMFVGWVGSAGEFSSNVRRWMIVAVAVLLAPVMYLVTQYALVALFIKGPSAMSFVLQYGSEDLTWLRCFAVAWLVAIPLAVSLIGRLLGAPITFKQTAASLVVFVCSYPVALILIKLLEGSVSANAIHAIKTGYVVPLQIIGLGIPFVPSRSQR